MKHKVYFHRFYRHMAEGEGGGEHETHVEIHAGGGAGEHEHETPREPEVIVSAAKPPADLVEDTQRITISSLNDALELANKHARTLAESVTDLREARDAANELRAAASELRAEREALRNTASEQVNQANLNSKQERRKLKW